MVLELLRTFPSAIESLLALPDWIGEHRELLSLAGVQVEPVNLETLEKISSLQTPNKVYALVGISPVKPSKTAVSSGLSLYLDGIQDPGNLGTILRIADWFGLAAVFCSPSCVEWSNPKVVQASMGSFFRTPVDYLTLPELARQYPGLPVWGATMEGESIYTASFSGNALVVIGSEAHGISPETAALIGHWTGIPPFGNSAPESLNAAVSAGIICAVLRGRETGFSPIPC